MILKYHLISELFILLLKGLYPNVARLDQVPSSDYELWHKDERLYFHNTSVNAKKRYHSSDKWLIFDEKFGTTKLTSVSKTAFTHPLALILFGATVVVKHVERLVIVDDWINIKMPAQNGVFAREIKRQLDIILQRMIDRADTKAIDDMEKAMIEGICAILSSYK